MHNITKLLRNFDDDTLSIANEIYDSKVSLLAHSKKGIKCSVEYEGETFVVFVVFAEDLSIINTVCSCDHINKKCVHVAAVLLYIKKYFLKQINKYKRENIKNSLTDLDYYKARDFIIKSIANSTLKKPQMVSIFLQNKNFTKDQRAALFSLGFANYLHEGAALSDFKTLMKPIAYIIDGFINYGYFTEDDIVRLIYDAVTLFDQNDFRKFLNDNITNPVLSNILQKVTTMLPNNKENCCLLIKEHENEILKGEIPLCHETLINGLLHYTYLENISFDVFKIGLQNAMDCDDIRNFSILLVLGFMRYPHIQEIVNDELQVFAIKHHVEFFNNIFYLLNKTDIDQINTFLVYLIYKIANDSELEKLKEFIHNKVANSKSVNNPLLLFAIREDSKYEITVTNSNYRQICQIIEFAKDNEKHHLTSLIIKRLENNFIECKHIFETTVEIEVLLKSHQDYVQFFLQSSLSKSVDKERRLFYLTLARKYKLLTKVGLYIFEE